MFNNAVPKSSEDASTNPTIPTLNKEQVDNNSFLLHCLDLLKENPRKTQLILSTVSTLPVDSLLSLYLLMLTEELDETAFSLFKELFKTSERYPQLLYLLSNTPTLSNSLMNELILQLDDKTLFTLIQDLLRQSKKNSEFNNTLNQLLLIFCQKLYTNQNPKSTIHQWVNQPFADEFAYHVLTNPECVNNLTTTNSTLYSWATWTDTATAFKLRIDAVLNQLVLDQEAIEQIARSWLGYFHNHTDQLYTLLYHLNHTDINRTLTGKANLLGIKQTFWKLIKPGFPYKEEDLISTLNAPQPALFDAVITQLTSEEALQKNPHLGAVFLANTQSPLTVKMNEDALIAVLIHSVHEQTLSNWKKAGEWLDMGEINSTLIFVKKLIDRVCRTNNNPRLNQQTYHLVTQSKLFDTLFPELDETMWFWFIKQSNLKQLNQNAPHWLSLLIKNKGAHTLNLGKIFSLVQQSEELIQSVLKREAFSFEITAQIFTQLSILPNGEIPFLCLHQWICDHDKVWIDQFLKITLNQMQSINTHTTALHVISALILTRAQDLNSENQEDRELITNYLKLLNKLIHQSEQSQGSAELKQLILSLINAFTRKEDAWAAFIFEDPSFIETVLIWLKNTEFNSLASQLTRHPLTALITDDLAAQFSSQLKTNPLFQKFIHTLLLNPPQKFQHDKFKAVLDLLLPENQVTLAKQLLREHDLSNTPERSISILSSKLTITELYELFEQTKHSALIAKELLTHSHGVNTLSSAQQKQLVESISATPNFLGILNHPTPLETRTYFVKKLFDFYGNNAKTLNQKLEKWSLTPDLFIVLCTLPIDKSHQLILDRVLQEKPDYLNLVNQYLQHPSNDKPLNSSSYLFFIAQKHLLNPLNNTADKVHLNDPKSPSINAMIVKQIFVSAIQDPYLYLKLKALPEEQKNWLFAISLEAAPNDSTLVPDIIKLSSWSWLEKYMRTKSPQNFELIKIGLRASSFLTAINQNEQTQDEFFSTLEFNQFTHQHVLELINVVEDSKVKSLLIIHLLNQANYLNNLKGESLLTRLTINETHSPSRLNVLIHQLDITTMTPNRINKLQPEAAVSLLCSIPHFHQLNVTQIDALLKIYPQPEVIAYWLNHFVTMPNAHFMLAHLIKLADSHVSSELKKMDGPKKEAVVTNLIKHLEWFNPGYKLLYEKNEETQLILAIRLFNSGHQHPAYVTYINQLTNKLLNKSHPFSLLAIQLIISLNGKQEFSELNTKTAYLTNHYLRSMAQSGAIELFYDEGRINPLSMTQPIQLKPVIPNSSAFKGLFHTHVTTSSGTNEPKENPLIEQLFHMDKSVTAFDYYLMNFKGDSTQVSNAISDYLGYYAQEGINENRRKSIYHTSLLMTREEIELPVREALFNSFLHYPELYDEQISYDMFRFNAQRTIQYFGLQGGEENYKRVIDLCSGALSRLNPDYHQDIIAIAHRAQAEALLELTFNEERGFFAMLFRHIKRCWVCGWTGFFSPNLPIFVAPASTTTTQSGTVANEDTPSDRAYLYKPTKTIPVLLQEIKGRCCEQNLNELMEALKIYSLEAEPKEEQATRKTLYDLFQRLSQEGRINEVMENWLIHHQTLIEDNRYRLVELLLETDHLRETHSLLKQIKEPTNLLQQYIRELICPPPEQKTDTMIETAPIKLSSLTEAASEFASAWAVKFSGFFMNNNPTEPPLPALTNINKPPQ